MDLADGHDCVTTGSLAECHPPRPCPTGAPRNGEDRKGSSTNEQKPLAAISVLHARLHRILDVRNLLDLDVAQFALDLLDAPDIDRLDDVARVGIDTDLPARALPGEPLGGGDQGLSVGLAAGLLQGLVDQVHPVPAADRVDVGVAATISLAVRLH